MTLTQSTAPWDEKNAAAAKKTSWMPLNQISPATTARGTDTARWKRAIYWLVGLRLIIFALSGRSLVQICTPGSQLWLFLIACSFLLVYRRLKPALENKPFRFRGWRAARLPPG